MWILLPAVIGTGTGWGPGINWGMQESVEHLELEENVPLKKSMTSEGRRERTEKVLGGAIAESRAEVSLWGPGATPVRLRAPQALGNRHPVLCWR